MSWRQRRHPDVICTLPIPQKQYLDDLDQFLSVEKNLLVEIKAISMPENIAENKIQAAIESTIVVASIRN